MLGLLTAQVAQWVLLAGPALGLIVTLFYKSRQDGKKEVKNEQLELQLEEVKKVREIKNASRRVRGADLDNRLDRWMRD